MHARKMPLLLLVIFMIACITGVSQAAMFPDDTRSADAKTETVDGESPLTDGTWMDKLLGPYRGLALGLATLLTLLILRSVSTRYVRRFVTDKAFKEENALKFMRTWKSLWAFLITVITLIALSGSLGLLGLSAGFLGMMLGWSLQAPVTGIAAWLMLIVKRPFRIGDRVIIAGIIGDVTDITLTHIVLNQVGGTIGGEERSGRGILIPNAIMFSQVITNYTLDAKFMLDEVPVRVTFDSDFQRAKEILLDSANQITGDIIAETGQQPFIRCEFFDAGVLIRLRYQSVAARRQEISSRIVEIILQNFKQNFPLVKFCYPHSVVRYKLENEPPPPLQSEQ